VNMTAKRPPNRTLSPAILVMSVALLVLAGCAKSTPVILLFEGGADLNGGYACRVCIYQLKTDANFTAVPLETFWGNGPAPFQADLAEPQAEVMLDPGERIEAEIKISKETNFIGAAADFLRPDRDAWRIILPVSSNDGLLPASLRNGDKITLIVSAGRIEIKR